MALDLDVQAHIMAPSVTYGLTRDLDVNVTLPLLAYLHRRDRPNASSGSTVAAVRIACWGSEHTVGRAVRVRLAAQADPIATPFFFQIDRNDLFDSSTGVRWRFADAGFVGLNAMAPLNGDAGLRPELIPVLEAEYAF